MQAQLDRMEAKLDKLLTFKSEKKKEAAQRKNQYKEAKERREKGKVSLPTTHVLLSRDRRISERIPNWASVGMKFGRADNPEGFLRWLCSVELVLLPQEADHLFRRVLQGAHGPH